MADREEFQGRIAENNWGKNESRVVNVLLRRPLANIALVQERLGVSYPTAKRARDQLVSIGLFARIAGRRRNNVSHSLDYVNLF